MDTRFFRFELHRILANYLPFLFTLNLMNFLPFLLFRRFFFCFDRSIGFLFLHRSHRITEQNKNKQTLNSKHHWQYDSGNEFKNPNELRANIRDLKVHLKIAIV